MVYVLLRKSRSRCRLQHSQMRGRCDASVGELTRTYRVILQKRCRICPKYAPEANWYRLERHCKERQPRPQGQIRMGAARRFVGAGGQCKMQHCEKEIGSMQFGKFSVEPTRQ